MDFFPHFHHSRIGLVLGVLSIPFFVVCLNFVGCCCVLCIGHICWHYWGFFLLLVCSGGPFLLVFFPISLVSPFCSVSIGSRSSDCRSICICGFCIPSMKMLFTRPSSILPCIGQLMVYWGVAFFQWLVLLFFTAEVLVSVKRFVTDLFKCLLQIFYKCICEAFWTSPCGGSFDGICL